MNITDEEVARFQEIWREEFGEEISVDVAKLRIGQLDALYLLLTKAAKAAPETPPR